MHKQFKYYLTLVLKILFCRLSTWNSTTMSFNSTPIANLSDSDNECYKVELARRYAEAEALLWQQEEKERLEHQAWKEAKIAERKRLEEEAWRKQEEEESWQREEECQRDLAHRLKADCIATMEQQRCKNWAKTFLPPCHILEIW